MEAITTIGKSGVILEEYKGEIALVATREGNDGKHYKQYATYQMGKDKHAEKDWPVRVSLGNTATAIATLRMLLAELGGKDEPGPGRQEPPIPDDIPF
jgi:hypothetical protein